MNKILLASFLAAIACAPEACLGQSVPAAPEDLLATAGPAQVALNWSASSGATNYNLYRGTTAGGEGATPDIKGITATSYTDTGLTNGTIYFYKVVAVDNSGTSSFSNEANVTPQAGDGSGDINLTGYTLAFDDEFNTLSLSTTNPKESANWYGLPPNGSAGYFSESNWNSNAFTVSNGILTDQTYYSGGWQSGFMASVDPSEAGFAKQYGYFEIRCQMPDAGTGAWPAFWLDTTSGISGEANEEVDIFEWYGVCDTPGSYQSVIQQASHNWSASGADQITPYLYSPQTQMPGGAYPWQGYHIYGCQIDPAHITWYIDGVQTNQIASPASYMTTPFYVMIDYAIGGGWPLSGTPFATDGTSSLLVDWVRVYSLPTNAAPAAPLALSARPSNNQVALSWKANYPGATSYNIYRGTSSGGESSTPVATGITTTYYTNTGLTNGTTYYYEVAAVNSTGTSGLSSEVSATPSSAASSGTGIGIQFEGSGAALSGTDLAGHPSVAQTNWTVLTGAMFSKAALFDSTGAGTTATLTGTANGIFHGGYSTAPPEGNADLASGEIWNGSTAGSTLLTVSGIPYSNYDVYVYVPMDYAGRSETVQLTASGSAAQYYSFTTEGGGSAWTLATNTWDGTGTAPTLPNANYVLYTGLTAGSFSLVYWAPGNGGISAIQIVPVAGGVGGAPAAPAGLGAAEGNTQVALSWAPSPGAVSYNVYAGTSSGGESATPIATGVITTSYTNTGLSNGTTYYYVVAAVNDSGTSGYSNEASATPAANAPAAPTGLAATAGNTHVALNWTASLGATSYNVYAGTSSGGESATPIVTGVSTTSCTNTGLSNGSTYYFEVAAINSSGTSGYSNEASATPVTGAPAAPTGLAATAGNTQVALNWTASTGATSYNVYSGTSSGGESAMPLATEITTTYYTNTGLSNGSTYYYEVAAVNSSGTSGYSNEAGATASSSLSSGTSIGVSFYVSDGPTSAIPPGDAAGISSVAADNWNCFSGSTFSSQTLNNSSGSNSGATLTGTAAGRYWAGGSDSAPQPGNADMASGELYNGSTSNGDVLTVSGLSYSSYDVYVYASIDASGRAETIELTPSGAAPQYYSFTTEGAGSAWTAATSTWNGTGAQPSLPAANYVEFTGLTAGSFHLTWFAPGNGAINGFQIVSVSGDGGAPAAPTALGATAGNAQVALNWTASTGATSYTVYAGTTSGGESSTPITTGITTTSYTNTGLSNGTTYYYEVAAINSSGTSGYSNEASATPSLPTYSQWANTYFTIQQLSDPTICGAAATPQNDGVTNLLKYLFDINPAVPMNGSAWAALPAIGTATLSGSSYLTLTYRQNPAETGLAINVQISPDLQTWQTVTPIGTLNVGTDPATGDPLIQLRVTVDPPGASKEFIRLNVIGP